MADKPISKFTSSEPDATSIFDFVKEGENYQCDFVTLKTAITGEQNSETPDETLIRLAKTRRVVETLVTEYAPTVPALQAAAVTAYTSVTPLDGDWLVVRVGAVVLGTWEISVDSNPRHPVSAPVCFGFVASGETCRAVLVQSGQLSFNSLRLYHPGTNKLSWVFDETGATFFHPTNGKIVQIGVGEVTQNVALIETLWCDEDGKTTKNVLTLRSDPY